MSGLLDSTALGGDQPGRLALSDESSFLYIAVNANKAIRRMDLSNQLPDAHWQLGTTAYGAPYTVANMKAIPNNPRSLAIVRRIPVGITGGDVAIIDNGSIRSNTVPTGPGNYNFLEVSNDGEFLFGMFGIAWDFTRLAVDAFGLTLADITPDVTPTADLRMGDGLVFTALGAILDPNSRKLVKTIPGIISGSLVFYDKMTSRAFYLVPNGTNWLLQQFDGATGFPLGAHPISGVLGTPSSLIRWGPDGVGFRTSSNQLLIVRTTIFPVPPRVDLAVTITDFTSPTELGSNITYTICVSK